MSQCVQVIINDYVDSLRYQIVLMTDDLEFANQRWGDSDKLLVDLQSVSLFKGCETWSDLTPTHYRLLLTRATQQLADVDSNDEDANTSVMGTINFLCSLLILTIQRGSECFIDTLRVNRLPENVLTFDFTASLADAVMQRPPPAPAPVSPPTGFQVVVDNSND